MDKIDQKRRKRLSNLRPAIYLLHIRIGQKKYHSFFKMGLQIRPLWFSFTFPLQFAINGFDKSIQGHDTSHRVTQQEVNGPLTKIYGMRGSTQKDVAMAQPPKISGDWIQTADLWFEHNLLFQLCNRQSFKSYRIKTQCSKHMTFCHKPKRAHIQAFLGELEYERWPNRDQAKYISIYLIKLSQDTKLTYFSSSSFYVQHLINPIHKI